jgi:general secretion pathway protein K
VTKPPLGLPLVVQAGSLRHPGRSARTRIRRGGALLAVLWLTAALSAIAFSLAVTVRGEIERTSTSVDGVRAQYLAQASVHRAAAYVVWSQTIRAADGTSPYYSVGQPAIRFSYPGGEAVAAIIPEVGKLNINFAPEEELVRLFLALGVAPPRALEIAGAVIDWRSPVPEGELTPFDHFYLSLTPSFASRHASFQEIEELLMVRGMTPEIFHGTYTRDSQDRLVPIGGARDCLSVYGSVGPVDANTAHPAVLAAVGLTPGAIAQILERRAFAPFRSMEEIRALGEGPGFDRLGFGGKSLYTVRASARLRLQDGRLSDLERSAAALIKLMPYGSASPYHVLRWYDNEWVPFSSL